MRRIRESEKKRKLLPTPKTPSVKIKITNKSLKEKLKITRNSLSLSLKPNKKPLTIMAAKSKSNNQSGFIRKSLL